MLQQYFSLVRQDSEFQKVSSELKIDDNNDGEEVYSLDDSYDAEVAQLYQ